MKRDEQQLKISFSITIILARILETVANPVEPSIVYARELANIANPKFVTAMYEFLTNKNDLQLNVEELRL